MGPLRALKKLGKCKVSKSPIGHTSQQPGHQMRIAGIQQGQVGVGSWLTNTSKQSFL